MNDKVFKLLEQERQPEVLDKIRDKCEKLVKMSRKVMAKKYDDWDRANAIYLGLVDEDSEDKRATDKKEPGKMVVPFTFAQVQSFVTFVFLLLLQNSKFYELQGTGPEDYGRDCENVLARDLRRNSWPVKLYQILLDVAKFGLGVTNVEWAEDYVWVPREKEVPPTKFLGMEITKGKVTFEMEKFLKYKGNDIKNVSPYNFFPDTRLPLSEMQKGEFCAIDEEYSKGQLLKLEQDQLVAGTKHIPDLTHEWCTREKMPSHRFGGDIITREGQASSNTKLITKVQIDLIPKELEIGEENFPVRYHAWIGNHQRIVRLEPTGYLHGQFTVNCGEFTPDMHGEMGKGLAGVIDYLQNVATWLINSHITSVRRTIDSKFIIDPAGIDVKQLSSRSPYIMLRKNVSRSGVDRWIKQLQTVDATGGHMTDADSMGKMIQMVTGINDNAQGQYNSGRRSATEARAVTAGAASRLRMHTSLLWHQLFDPQGQQMLANSRQGMDEELWIRVIGEAPQDEGDAREYVERYQRFLGTPEAIAGMDDFMTYDATLPSEKGFIAQSMQDLLGIAMSNPETSFALNLNTGKMAEEIARLRGLENVEKWRMTPEDQQELYARIRLSQQSQLPVGPDGQPQQATAAGAVNPQQ